MYLINFIILKDLRKAPASEERCVRSRLPTTLIRGVPSIRTVICKARDSARVAAALSGFDCIPWMEHSADDASNSFELSAQARACNVLKTISHAVGPDMSPDGVQDFCNPALVILTTDFGWSSRGVVTTKPADQVVRARSSSTVFSKTSVSECAKTFMSSGKPARAR